MFSLLMAIHQDLINCLHNKMAYFCHRSFFSYTSSRLSFHFFPSRYSADLRQESAFVKIGAIFKSKSLLFIWRKTKNRKSRFNLMKLCLQAVIILDILKIYKEFIGSSTFNIFQFLAGKIFRIVIERTGSCYKRSISKGFSPYLIIFYVKQLKTIYAFWQNWRCAIWKKKLFFSFSGTFTTSGESLASRRYGRKCVKTEAFSLGMVENVKDSRKESQKTNQKRKVD